MRQKNRTQQILCSTSKESPARSPDKIFNNNIRSPENMGTTHKTRHDRRTSQQKNMVFEIPTQNEQTQQIQTAQTNETILTQSEIFRGFEK